MFNVINKIVYFFLSLQEKALRKNLKKNFKSSYSNSTSKVVFGNDCSLKLTSKTEKNKEKLKHDVETVLKKYRNDPEKLLNFVERSGTCIYRIPYANKLLALLGYEEGFVGELSGLKALYLTIFVSILSGKKVVSMKTKPMFVLRNTPVNNFYMIQQFHKWYAMKLNLPGFDTESQANFQKFMTSANDDDIKTLSVQEILGLKEAIARDVEAINFVVALAKGTEGSKSAMQKLVAGGTSV